jgi:hypothetical protein
MTALTSGVVMFAGTTPPCGPGLRPARPPAPNRGSGGRPGHLEHQVGQLAHRELVGVADVDRPDLVAVEQSQDAAHLVVDVAEAAGLGAVAVDGDGLAVDRLHQEVRHHPPVVRSHLGPVGVEDANDPHVDAVEPVVGHGDGLGEALGLVVHAAGPDRVHVAPVGLDLGVDLGVAVDLAGGGEQEAGALLLGHAQAVVGTEAADLQRLDGQLEVVLGRGRAGEVQHGVDPAGHVHVVRHVLALEHEAGLAEELLEVVEGAGDQVVERHHLVAAGQQGLAQVRAEEPGAAGDDHPHQARPRPS